MAKRPLVRLLTGIKYTILVIGILPFLSNFAERVYYNDRQVSNAGHNVSRRNRKKPSAEAEGWILIPQSAETG